MRGLFNIAIGIFMIVGGLSGHLVLKGTNSGEALAVVGLVVLGIGFYRMFSQPANAGAAPEGSPDDVR